MKTTRLLRAMAVMAVAIFYFIVARPSSAVTTTALYSTTFSSSSNFYAWSGYMSSFDGWYWTSYGRGGFNGSIGFNTYYGRNEQGITSPAMDASAFATDADSTFVEFDLCMPKNYYDLYNGSSAEFYVKVGGTQMIKITKSDYSAGYYYSYSYTTSASSWSSTSYWRHYRVHIPKAQRSAAMQITLSGKGTNSYGYYYPQSQPFFVDNITVTNYHYTMVTVAPTTLAFGELGKGLTSGAQYVLITNPNSTPVNISNIALSGSNPGDFQIVYTPGQIQPGTSDSIGVVFTPTYKNFRAATLVFNTDVDIPASARIDLNGFCLVPNIALSDNVYFRKTHTKFDQDVTTTIPFTNTGLSPLLYDSANTHIEGDAAPQYELVYQPSTAIMPGAVDSLVVRFTPMQEGQQAAYLHLNTNADNGEQVVTLKASGVVPHLEISPRNVYFDTTNLGTSRTVTLSLFNSGTDTLAITGNFLTGSDYDFTITSLSGTDTLIAPSQTKTVMLTFNPLRTGTRVGRVHLTTNIPLTFESPRRDTSVFDVNIMAYVKPIGILSASTLALDSAIVGTESCQSGTFSNTGAADLTVTSATIVGADSSEFALSGVTYPTTIVAGGSQSYSICATPADRGSRSAILVLNGTSNGQPLSIQLPISAVGLQVCANAQATTALSTQTCAGYTDTATVTVNNCGDVATPYTASLASGSGFTLVDAAPSASVAPGGSTTFRVAFAPAARGTTTTTLTVNGGTGVSPMSVQIDGHGTSATIVGSGTAPATAVGSTSTPFEVGVQNTGECDFTPGVPTVTGPFTYVSGGDQPIAPGASGTLLFTFTPTTAGDAVGVLGFPNSTGVSLPAPNVTIAGSTPASVAKSEAYGFSLGQNYPNPFYPKAQIDFVVPYSARVQLDVLDAKGSFVATLFSGVAEQGTHTAMVDANTITRAANATGAALSSGTYFYRLTSENPTGAAVVLIRQMILVK